ncbi:MAG TPA: TonB-dependent receptor [Roseateles sp.]|uniref:TonB-dependent receptor n=1 Tax=Roseateles sp. TaxID=1971397 RepID=UPI002ED857B1
MFKAPNANDRHPARWLSVPIATFIWMGCGAADAAEPVLAARYQIEQPSQDVADALRAIARATGTSVIFDARAVAGRTAKPVSGSLSGAEAIAIAIKGSGLESQIARDGAVIVRPAASPAATPPAPAGSGSAPDRTGAAAPPRSSIQASAEDDSTNFPKSLADNRERSDGEAEILRYTRVEVTGSRLRRVDAEGPAPVNVYTAKDIEKSGQPSLHRFLTSLTEVSVSTGEGGFSRTAGQGTVQLRGLPLGSTLVLLNGRKLQAVGSSTGSVFNLNLIPLAAIERVEVVPSGSSAVYGGDALAGVINVILKKSMDGQSLAARLGSGRGFGDGSVSIATGGRSKDGNYLVVGSFSRSTPLTERDRSFFNNLDFRSIGGNDDRSQYCSPGNVSSVSGNLPGLNSNVAGIPQLAPAQIPTISDFQATAGNRNLCNQYLTGGGLSLVHGDQNIALHSLAEHRIWGSWSAFAEGMFVKDRIEGPGPGVLLASVSVPASNLFNPFGAAVRVSSMLGNENGHRSLLRESRFSRVLAGVRGELASDWDAELTVSSSQDHGNTVSRNEQVNSAALSAALASTNPATAFNPFTSGRAASDDVLRGILRDTTRRDRGRKDQVGAIVRGNLSELWAGPVDVVVGAEAARDWYDMVVPGQSDTHGYRNSAAAYGELRAPLLAAREEGGKSWDRVALTLASRRDRYSDFGSATTFQGGLEVRPTRSLLIRGSAAGSFKPPSLLQTNVVDIVYDAATFSLYDPLRNAERVAGTVVRTTNKDLQPERGQARGIGVVWEPEGGLGSRFSATYWQLKIRSMIALLSADTALAYEASFPTFVTRGPAVNGRPGAVTSVKTAEVNFGRLDTAGTDLDASYVWMTPVGRVAAGVGATRVNSYRVQLVPGAAVEDRLGRRFSDFWAPRWKGRASLGLEGGAWSVGLTSRYLGSYLNAGTSQMKLGDYWVHDVAGNLNLKKLWPELLPRFKAATFGVTITNSTDRMPQYVPGAPNFDVTQADWRGRYLAARLSLDW